MDIVNPNTIWIRERCYRVITPLPPNSNNYIEDDLYPDTSNVYEDEVGCGMEDDSVQLINGKYIVSISIASAYYPYIIGGKGATKRRIETETYTQIRIPSKGKLGDIVIQGKDAKTVRAAKIKLEMLVDQARKRQPFTHFLSLPFTSTDIQEGYRRFKEEVLKSCSDCRGVDASLFQSESKLHLTLCVMVLADDRERHETCHVLEQCHQTVLREKIGEEALRLELRGVEYMNDDPGEVDVLYGKVSTLSPSHDLQDITDAYVNHLVHAGLVQRQYEKVKLHVTLLNTLFRRDADNSNENDFSKQRESFDARRILKDYEDFYFGEIVIKEIHLSVRFTTSSSGYYKSSCTLPLSPVTNG